MYTRNDLSFYRGTLLILLKPACDDPDCEGKEKVCQLEVSSLFSAIYPQAISPISNILFLGREEKLPLRDVGRENVLRSH